MKRPSKQNKTGNDAKKRVAIITGADRGIGFQVSRELGWHGSIGEDRKTG